MIEGFRGKVVFGALAPPPLPLVVQREGNVRSASVPGMSLSWNPARVDVAADARALALASGRARGSDSTREDEAACWLDRYARLGNAAASNVGGGFAVVIVDFARRKVLLFVDRFGIESLCYRHDHGSVAFSDRACDIPGDPGPLDPQALFDYLFFHAIPSPRTVYAGVRRVEARHRVVASGASIEAEAYWNPEFVEDDRTALHERMRSFVTLVERAVEEEADDDRTTCFLSGGTDSSTVAGMLTKLRGKPASAYSIGFAADGYDEMAYARIAARHFGLDHHEYYLTPDDLVDAIPKVATSLDQPFGNSSVLPAYFCALRAREDGFTRMLAGDGGDELYGGNSRYALQKVFDVYHRLPAALRTAVLEPVALRTTFYRRVPGLRQLGGYVRHAHAPMPDRLNAFNLLQHIGLHDILEPDFLAQVDSLEPVQQQRRTWDASSARSLVNRMLAYDWKYTLADSDLPKVRYATRLANVSVGYPFLSRELTELSLQIPAEWKVRGTALRWFFKRALRDFLPQEILRKKKHGFGLPFGTWLLQHRGLLDVAEDALDTLSVRGIVRSSVGKQLIRRKLADAPGFYGELAWILMMLELWIRGRTVPLTHLMPKGAGGTRLVGEVS